MRCLLLLILLSCNIPSEEDVREAANNAADNAAIVCREIIESQVPTIISNVTTAALSACISIGSQIEDVRQAVESNKELIVYEVLINLGCIWDSTTWDCSASKLLCSGN